MSSDDHLALPNTTPNPVQEEVATKAEITERLKSSSPTERIRIAKRIQAEHQEA